jgi:uncharacterized protein (TIGR02231 family)
VYQDRALVTRVASGELGKGLQTAVFTGLPRNLEPKSINVKGNGPAVLKDIRFSWDQPDTGSDPARAALLQERDRLQDSVNATADRMARTRKEIQLVESIAARITLPDPENKGPALDPDKWNKVLAFYREKLDVLDREARSLEKKARDQQEALNAVNRKITNQGLDDRKLNGRVEALLEMKSAAAVTLTLSYIVYSPSWTPAYELRASTDGKKMSLAYNARVRQNTGEDWKNISLQLSAARPQISGNAPELNPWRIDFAPIYPLPGRLTAKLQKRSMMAPAPAAMARAVDMEEAGEPMPVEEAVMEAKATSVVFSVTGKTTILSDNQLHQSAILIQELPVQFRHTAVPKLFPAAYLKAQAVNTTGAPLLSGETGIFLDNQFVANGTLEPVEPKLDKNSKTVKLTELNYLEWSLEPEPGQTVKIPFIFSVEYPAGQTVPGLP